jgi:hypothetical protein
LLSFDDLLLCSLSMHLSLSGTFSIYLSEALSQKLSQTTYSGFINTASTQEYLELKQKLQDFKG